MENILLIGTGAMAVDYANVLIALGQKFTVIGRGNESAKLFEEKTGIMPITGGAESYLSDSMVSPQTVAIIATGTEALMPTLLLLYSKGIKKILVEKPAAVSIEELIENKAFLEPVQDSVFIAYNRRFYASVIEAKKMILEDGGLQSMNFEFTEWAHRIEPLQKAPGVKENWFFANSTHVVDLAFYLAGTPSDWSCFSKPRELKWHPKTNFSGAGITEKGVLFAYLSNWESAGRWALELLTSKRRIYLKPIEEIMVQAKGSIAVEKHEFDDSIDKKFKPGLFRQVEAFLNGHESDMLTIKEHIRQSRNIFAKILNG